ncbi:RHS repeat domain-containing protein [Serratia sp. M24T3]|uniref:RHS repeat domain-containing protein n=1 Tax=Serratia sp. M24T3 TaxID=932213 RepID=UPI00025BB227|nr:RHS repeat protein [Serratia sp. M24T3]EIC83168.1 nematicidal protein [Serratia sp. M24T3]
MSEGNTIFTQAFNFVSAAQGRVDPRTGIFLFNFPLENLAGNDKRGPFLDMTLRYSPMLTENLFGLGVGVTLGLSSYDSLSKVLTLSTGEMYKVDEFANSLTIRQNKLDNIRIKKYTEGSDTFYRIVHKSGQCEYLTTNNGASTLNLPRYIESPLGSRLKLKWNGHNQLLSVTDDDNICLCKLSYQSSPDNVAITLFPEKKDSVELLLSFTTASGSQYLHNIENTSLKNNLKWSLNYSWDDDKLRMFGKCILKEVTAPTGLTEQALYDPQAMRVNHQFGTEFVPAIIRLITSPGYGQPDMTVNYSYTGNNYLGGTLQYGQFDAGNDYIYSFPTDYIYGSTETQKAPEGQQDKIIQRTYNSYHLQTIEKIASGDCITSQITKYFLKENFDFEKQPSVLQMPQKVTKVWQKGAELKAPEVTEYDYDKDAQGNYSNSGNLVSQKAPDGTVTTHVYYSCEGEEGCPADAFGFRRYIKSTTVTPPKTSYADEPVSCTEYRYQKFTPLAGSAVSYAVLKESETLKINGTSKFREQLIYHTQAGVNFGRVKSKLRTRYSTHGKTFSVKQTLSMEAQGETLIQSVKNQMLSEDGITPLFTTESSSKLCRHSGHLLSETDVAGNTVAYAYDALGRILSQTHHPDKPAYTSTETYSYTLPERLKNQPASTIHTDVLGNKMRVDYDGLGREITQWVIDRDSKSMVSGQSDAWQLVSTNHYDKFGAVFKVTGRDILNPGSQTPQILESSQVVTQDNWGQSYSTTGQDGVIHYNITDPIALSTTSWSSSQNGRQMTGKQVTHFSETHHPLQTEIFLIQGNQYSTQSQSWDGVGRLRKSTDALLRSTLFNYDEEDRVISTSLSDGSKISKTYAPFSTGKLVTQISVTDKNGKETVLGTQKFDRLGRLLETTSGGRTSVMTYTHAWQTRPTSVKGPDGVVTRTVSDPNLGDAVTHLYAGEGAGAVTQSFDYHLPTAMMTKATENNSSNRWLTYPSGRVKSEMSIIHGGTEKSVGYQYSLAGAVEKDSDIENVSRQRKFGVSGTSTGQLLEVSDSELKVTPHYDEFQRVTGWEVVEISKKHTLTTSLTFDDFGRETARVVAHSNGETYHIRQNWNVNSQLESRTRLRGSEVLSNETYLYDSRNRLVTYKAGPLEGQLPKDAYGNAFTRQDFTFDVLGNITTCTTMLKNGSQNVATYHFENSKDPCQLTSVTNSLSAKEYPAKIALTYDAAGRMILDEAGRKLSYDALGRLQSVAGEKGSGRYGYNAQNVLSWQIVDKTKQLHRLYYRSNKLVNEWMSPEGQPQSDTKDSRVRLVYAAGSNVAQINHEGDKQTTSLIGTDSKSSIMTANEEGKTREYRYTAYGTQAAEEK